MIIQATDSVTARLLSALSVIMRANWSWRKDREKKILSLPLSLIHFFFSCVSVFYLYICVPCACPMPMEARRLQSPGDWNYRWLWAFLWVLGTEPGSFVRATGTRNCWDTSLVPKACLFLNKIFIKNIKVAGNENSVTWAQVPCWLLTKLCGLGQLSQLVCASLCFLPLR